jgi:hypothetical protein
MTLLALLAQAQSQPSASTIVQSMMLAALILFVISVIATGFTTKKIDNISEATFGKAFLATFLKNMLFWPAFMIGLTLEGMPPLGAFAIAAVIVPMLVYKVVYSCMWRETFVVWLAVSAVEFGSGYGLTLVGLASFEAFGA